MPLADQGVYVAQPPRQTAVAAALYAGETAGEARAEEAKAEEAEQRPHADVAGL
jgi:hypothetical protein